jgi:serine/threonine protein kinase
MNIAAATRLGRYEIRSKIGAGGMGQVYLARDTSELDRTVAVKLLPAEVAADSKRMQRFVQEARTVSSLNPSECPHQLRIRSGRKHPFHCHGICGRSDFA